MFGTSKTAKFYMLTSTASAVASADYTGFVGVSRVQLPKYMDRPQIVTQRKNSAQMTISEFNRWVESPAVLVTRALTENIGTLLPAAQIKQPRMKGGDVDRSITVEIVKLDAVLGEQAALTAWGTIKDRNGKVQANQKFEYTVPVGKTYDDLAQAYNQLLADLSQGIATVLINK
jgi:uncharacterized lipoprotein YmbA